MKALSDLLVIVKKNSLNTIALFSQLRFFGQNVLLAKKFSCFPSDINDELILRAYNKSDIEETNVIVDKLNNGIGFDFPRRVLYRLAGSKLILVAVSLSTGKVAGVQIFYFNSRDVAENTIHEGFVGVLPEYQGKGFSSKLRKHAIESFSRTGLSGISTRISISNIRSFRSAQRLGFRIVETYYDPDMAEKRCYLVRFF